jgi:alpha-tubulin suppressor-like RCC1 family protein
LVRGLTNVVDFDIGKASCAIRADRSLHCWGENWQGQVGDGTRINRLLSVPILVGEQVLKVRAGPVMTCALLADRTVRCWGPGIIGDGTPLSVSENGILTPRVVSNLANVTDLNLSGGSYNACALLSDQTARCWGRNRHGEVGDGTLTTRLTPAEVFGLDTIVQIDTGDRFTCALLANSEVRCWGWNYHQSLGYQTDDSVVLTTDRGPALRGFREITMGTSHVCGLNNNGGTYCWGWNIQGEVGDGTNERRVEPILIE